jgi:predicted ATP-dependent endonuclease of OLD family
MFLKRLKLRNYRLFNDIDVSFQQGMNVLIGKNSTGKSTILEAIDFLLSNGANIPVEEIIPYNKRTHSDIQVYIEGLFVMSETEKSSIIPFLENDNDINVIKESVLEIKYSKTIVKADRGVHVNQNIQINGNEITDNVNLA